MSEQSIGRYRVLERVGRGGMGVLYRGVDPLLDREVAIKVMAGDFAEDEDARSRFFREARAAARLQHRNIITVFEFAEEGGVPYIVMEFLRGHSLAARMTVDPPLTLDETLDIASQLCTGLQFAHDHGVVHRDVKPANVWLRADRTVKLLDFGIAKLSASTVTRHGDVLGSACYMAPEQLAGGAIDGRADIFSAGVVLYEMLARRKPFDAASPTAVLLQIMQEEPTPIERHVPGLPAALLAALDRALRKSPAERYQTVADFGSDLDLIRMSLQSTGETVFGADFDLGDTVCLPGPMILPGSAAEAVAPVPVETKTGKKAAVVAVGIVVAILVLVILGWFVLGLAGAATVRQQAPRAQLDVRVVKQPYNLCLAASVSMVLDYWGYKVTTDKLAEQVGVYKEGTIGRDYVGVIERLGLHAFLIQPPFDDVLGHLARGRPVVIEVPERAGRHAMVLVGYDLAENKVWLNDPAVGERKVQALDAFRKEWEKGGRWTFLIVPKQASPPE